MAMAGRRSGKQSLRLVRSAIADYKIKKTDQQMKKTTLSHILILFFCSMLLSCNPFVAETGNDPDLHGTITISGAWALYPMMIRWAEEFQKIHPGVEFDISAGGAGKGMADAISGAVDIGMVSRDIHPEEIEMGAFWIAVARDAVFLTVNKDNPVWDELHQNGITREELIGIYITGEITSWGQVVGLPEVNESIHVFTRSDACGAAATWAGYLGGKQEDLLGIGVYGDPGVLDAVIKDPQGIGFNNLNYAFDFDTGLPVTGARVSPLDTNLNGFLEPEEIYDTKEAAVNAVSLGYYPSPPARDLNLVSKGQPVGLVKIFFTWILTEGQQYLSEMGYVALPQGKLDIELSKLEP
jgi:phosphate transport system substrate-binding protein